MLGLPPGGVKNGTATLDISPFSSVTDVPLPNVASGGAMKQVDSTRSLFPLFFVGGAYRVHERVVIGGRA
jgi:hypothetical protein